MFWDRSLRTYRLHKKVNAPLKLALIRFFLSAGILLSGLTPLIANYLSPSLAYADTLP